MENSYKIKNGEAICLIILLMINKLILNVPYYIVELVGNGAIINILIIGIVDFIVLLIIVNLIDKFESMDLLDISGYLGGPILKNIIGFFNIIFFYLVSSITLVDFCNVLHNIYFSDFSIIYIVLFFIIGISIANFIGIESISHHATFIVPLIIVSIFITFFFTLKNLSIENITPIFGKDYYTTFVKGLSNAFSMYIIVYIYYVKPLLKNQEDFKKISIISYIISYILLASTVISMLSLFESNSNNIPINSLFLLSRQIELGDFLKRIDSIFILLWISASFSYLSLIIFAINRTIKKLFNISNEKMITFSSCSTLFGLSLIPLNVSQIHFIENTIYRYIVLAFIFIIGIVLLILANMKRRRLLNEKKI